MYLVGIYWIYLIYTVPHLQKIKCIFKKKQEKTKSDKKWLFTHFPPSFRSWRILSSSKSQGATCWGTVDFRACVHAVHRYVHTHTHSCTLKECSPKQKQPLKKRGKKRKRKKERKKNKKGRKHQLRLESPLPARRQQTSTISGAHGAPGGAEGQQESPGAWRDRTRGSSATTGHMLGLWAWDPWSGAQRRESWLW